MCGLVGAAGNLQLREEGVMKRLLLVDYFRGTDSTGFAAIRSNGDAKIAKVASHPLDLFDMQRFKDALNGSASRAFIGHNRAATRGAVSSGNAHPFNYGDITGAHNGTLDYTSVRRLEEAIGEKFGVDSMAIFAGIDKLGVEATIGLMEEGKSSADGAWALTWYDNNDDSINILRNQHRPLWYAFNKNCDRLYWASEWHMLESAIRGQVGADFYEEGDGKARFFSFEPDVHYKFKCGELMGGTAEKGRPKPIAKGLKGREPLPATGRQYDPFNFTEKSGTQHSKGTDTQSSGKTSWTSKGGSSTTSSRSKPPAVLTLVGDVSHPLAGIITEETFNRIAKYGCAFCQTDVEFTDPGISVVERDDIVLCPKCAASANSRILLQSLEGLY